MFNGLPSDAVRAIAQDDAGALWFGTERGLARFDGRQVATVTGENFAAQKVFALRFAPDGSLFIGTENGAYLRRGNEFRQIAPTAGKSISAILLDATGDKVIFAALDGQIFECRAVEQDFDVTAIPAEPLRAADNEPNALLAMTSLAIHDGTLFVGTERRGLMRLDESGAKPVLREINSRPRSFFINALEQTANGEMWLGAQTASNESGLFLADEPERPLKIGDRIGTVTTVKSTANGDLWIGTKDNGAFHFRGAQQLEHLTFADTGGGLRSDKIFSIFVDRENVVWFGTDKGVSRYDQNAPRAENVSLDAESNFVRALFQDENGEILAGTNRGLFRFDQQNRLWQSVPNFERRTIHQIARVNQYLLVGTAGNLFVNNQPIEQGEISESVRAVAEFQHQIYLAAFARGLEKLENSRRAVVANSSETLGEAISLFNEADENLWIGTTQNGVFTFDGQNFRQISALAELRGAAVRVIAGNRQNGLWFGTARGLYLFRNNDLRLVAPDADVRALLLETDDGVWAATANNGLLRVRADENFDFLLSNSGVEQGLPSAQIFALLKTKDALLIGTNRGVARYNSSSQPPILSASRVLSRRVYSPAEIRRGIDFEFPQNALALEVAAVASRTFPEQFQYGFVLLDENGGIVKKRVSRDANFSVENLAPGHYAIEATAFDRDLLPSNKLRFDFSIAAAPFPITSTALGALLFVALIALTWAIVERRRITRRNRELRRAKFDLASEAERTRRRIARDLHDQTLADLRRLLLRADELKLETSNQADGFRQDIEAVSTEIRRICEDLSPSVLENVGLTAALEYALITAQTARRIEREFVCADDAEEKLDLPQAVQIQIYRIAQEVLSNINRHAEARQIIVKIEVDDNFTLTVEDDGDGFDDANFTKKAGRGLTNIRTRADLINAQIAWQPNSPRGTIFILRLINKT